MPAESGRSPVAIFMSIALAAMAIGGGYLAWDNHTRTQERERAAAAELAAADRARADQIRAESAAQRQILTTETGERRAAAIRQAVRQLSTGHPTTQCDGALALGRLRAREEIRLLEAVVEGAGPGSVRNCAAGALVDIGETHTALAAYERWARGDDRDLQRSALLGFGKIGPSAAESGLPYLRDALRSPHMDVRYLAVESLSTMGPPARPLLQLAARDADASVRARAAAALKAPR
jgi:HEAT repeat protein